MVAAVFGGFVLFVVAAAVLVAAVLLMVLVGVAMAVLVVMLVVVLVGVTSPFSGQPYLFCPGDVAAPHSIKFFETPHRSWIGLFLIPY